MESEQEYQQPQTVKLKVKRGITAELAKIEIPETIKEMANQIFLSKNSTKRKGKNTSHVLFYCIFNAYNKSGKYQSPKKIAQLVGLSFNEISQANSIFDYISTAEETRNDIFVSFLDLIPGYCQELGLEDHVNNILSLGREIRSAHSEVDDKFPQYVAAGLIYYYLYMYGVSYDRKDFAKKLLLTEITLGNMFKYISRLHNQ